MCTAVIVLSDEMQKELGMIVPGALPKSFVLHNPLGTENLKGVRRVGSEKIVYVGRLQKNGKAD